MSVQNDQPDYSRTIRPFWYDRNPLTYGAQWAGAAGPHIATQRWSFTIPPGRKAYVEFAGVWLMRETVAAPSARAAAQVEYVPAVGTAVEIAYASIVTNIAGDMDSSAIGLNILMYPGDTLRGFTWDGSTGGTIRYIVRAKITEFDA